MPSYICERCGCIDNSACGGNFWLVNMNKSKIKRNENIEKYFQEDYANIKYLCVECVPIKFEDGSINEKAGRWHNRFPKRHWSEIGKDTILKIAEKDTGDYINAEEYFGYIYKFIDEKIARRIKEGGSIFPID